MGHAKYLICPFLFSALLLLMPNGTEAKTDISKPHVYKNPAGKEFPIMGWVSIRREGCASWRFKEMREAGFNLSYSCAEGVDEIMKELDAAKGTGVKIVAYVADEHKRVKAFRKHKSLAGYTLLDEPSFHQADLLGKWCDSIRLLDDKHLLYYNLFPSDVEPEAINNDYECYARTFCEKVKTGLISFDHYPLIFDYLKPDYYDNLEMIRRISEEKGVPFWSFSLSTAHMAYPVATSDAMHLQIFSGLAYGSQGLQYFTYLCPGTEMYHNAPISRQYKRSEVYDAISDLNREIKNLTWVFLGAKVINVNHTGKNLPKGTKPLTILPSVIHKVSSDGEGLVVSHLQNGKNQFMLVVNRDPNHRQQVTVECDETVNRVMPSGKTVKASAYEPTLWVDAGHYLLFQWK